MKHRILVADDDAAARAGLVSLLSAWGFEVAEAADGNEALERAASFAPAVVITDMVMPGLDGIGLMKPMGELVPEATIILLTAHATVEAAVAAMKDGAVDFLTKPVDPARLRALVEAAIARADAEPPPDGAPIRRPRPGSRAEKRLLGKSPSMAEVHRQIELAALSSAPVLITGETGTGKELVARTIHEQSARGRGPFVAVNCSAIPETLLESELFGHERGAFTGAAGRRAGYFELADGGTLFLDEITEMSPLLQSKYLRVLQDGKVRRLGATGEVTVDVRIIAATNRDARKAVKDGTFRDDLYYRLNVLTISLPPLRRRREDLPLLVQAFIAEFDEQYDAKVERVDETALARLAEHSWPGNVRELRNVIERAVVGAEGPVITIERLPLTPVPEAPAPSPEDVVSLPVGTTLEDGERELILKTLESVNNNKTKAAEILGTTPKTLHNKARRWRENDAAQTESS